MDTNSRMFHKAVATIAKQVIAATADSSLGSHSTRATVTERRARRERVFDLHHGTLVFTFLTDYVF
jgi:hypothetical protein